jgi:hypothetical protein
LAKLNPSMLLVDGLDLTVRPVVKRLLVGPSEPLLNVGRELPLIPLQGQPLVGLLVEDFLGNRGLSADRLQRHDAACQLQII